MIIKLQILIFSVLFICQTPDRQRAEDAIMQYMSSKKSAYKALTFGELFKQTYPAEVQKKLGSEREVVYSFVHSYMIGSQKFEHDYFHLDKDYQVVGVLSDEEMTEISNELMKKSSKLDSILRTIEIPQ